MFIHLNSDDHKNHRNKEWCEDCNKYISDTTRHFQSEIHLRNKQNNFSLDTQQSCPSVQSASGTKHPLVQFDNNVELIVNENTYIKLNVNPTENLEYHINEF